MFASLSESVSSNVINVIYVIKPEYICVKLVVFLLSLIVSSFSLNINTLYILYIFQVYIAGPPFEPNDFEVMMETSMSVSVRWKAGFAAGYEPQTFQLEYKENTKAGKVVFLI